MQTNVNIDMIMVMSVVVVVALPQQNRDIYYNNDAEAFLGIPFSFGQAPCCVVVPCRPPVLVQDRVLVRN